MSKNKKIWHTKTTQEVFRALKSGSKGLSKKEIEKRRTRYGPNTLPEQKPDSIIRIFLRQFQSPLIYLLLGAFVVLFALREWIDAFIILAVLFINAIVGTIQAGKAQNVLFALKKLASINATVIREGKEIVIPAKEVVPGDIIVLQEGEKIPADARLVTAHNLRVDEAALTGESKLNTKSSHKLSNPKLSTADQKNMVFKGTHVVGGNAIAIVTATGTNTIIGNISQQITTIDTEIPIQKDIRHLSHYIMVAVLFISGCIFVFGLITGIPINEIFTLAVAVVVSAVPEGLPIVLTLLLATGVWRMGKKNVLVKRLQAVEGLGEAKVIAVDKTGTVTKNELVVREAFINNKMLHAEGVGYETGGVVRFKDTIINAKSSRVFELAGMAGALCSNARLKEEEEKWTVTGDPTEAAMLVFASKLGIEREELLSQHKQISELPFHPQEKYHATLHTWGEEMKMFVAGAPEVILEKCVDIQEDNSASKISNVKRKALIDTFIDMSKNGLRVIAIAHKNHSSRKLSRASVSNLTFIGFLGIQDALREEVHDAMIATKEANIRVVMITGDHKDTAVSIAKDAGIYGKGDEVLTGQQIDEMNATELAQKLHKATVFARVTPEHKLRLVQAYRLRGEVVAMTGDGVNDALSLVAADLGVAMGKSGTEVAKEASDLILLDDNFGSIVAAIEEGKGIINKLRKVLLFLFSTNIGELLVIMAALLLGYPLPILAAQLIWLNLVTDGFLDGALAMEKSEKDPRFRTSGRSRQFFDGWMIQRMILMALTMAIGSFLLFLYYLDGDLDKARTVALAAMAAFQWFKVWNCRSEYRSVFKINPFHNKYLLGATFLVILLQLGAIYTPLGQTILSLTPLSVWDWLLIVAVASSTTIVDEIRKFIYRRVELRHILNT